MACGIYVVRGPSFLFCSIVTRGGHSTAGADTTAVAMSWWTLAMILHPEVQLRAQRELDAMVGRSRVPSFADMPHLPYLCAIVREVLRWRPVTFLGMYGSPNSNSQRQYDC